MAILRTWHSSAGPRRTQRLTKMKHYHPLNCGHLLLALLASHIHLSCDGFYRHHNKQYLSTQIAYADPQPRTAIAARSSLARRRAFMGTIDIDGRHKAQFESFVYHSPSAYKMCGENIRATITNSCNANRGGGGKRENCVRCRMSLLRMETCIYCNNIYMYKCACAFTHIIDDIWM